MVFDIAQIIVGKGAGAFVFLSACHHQYSIIILISLSFLDLVFIFLYLQVHSGSLLESMVLVSLSSLLDYKIVFFFNSSLIVEFYK